MRINGVGDVFKLAESAITGLINGAGGIIAGIISLLVIWHLGLMLWDAVKSPRTKPPLDWQFVAAIAGLVWVLAKT